MRVEPWHVAKLIARLRGNVCEGANFRCAFDKKQGPAQDIGEQSPDGEEGGTGSRDVNREPRP
jgi:hypothetical protein